MLIASAIVLLLFCVADYLVTCDWFIECATIPRAACRFLIGIDVRCITYADVGAHHSAQLPC